MALSPAAAAASGTSRATRVRIGLQVGLTLLLALVTALLVDWLSERPGLRLRVDLSRERQNTLSPATLEVLERLPVEARVDVFFNGRALERPLEALGLEVQEHTRRMLRLMLDAVPTKLTVEEQDLSDLRDTQSRALARMHELDLTEIEPGGVLVVSASGRKQVLHLRGDLCDIDPGQPGSPVQPPLAPRVLSLRAEEALASALHKVAMESEPHVLFTTGHGELDPDSTDHGGAAALRQVLQGDGFRTTRWDIEKQGPIPAECHIVVILGPGQPFSAHELDELRAFLDGGGRLVAAPDYTTDIDGPGSLAAFLATLGIQPVMQGLLARPIAQASGGPLVGVPQCAQIIVFGDGMAAQNPVTEPLRRAGRRVYLPFARALERSNPPPGGTVIPILRSDDQAWRDLGDPTDPRTHDWKPNEGEQRGPFVVAMQAVFPARSAVPAARALPGGRAETRIVCVGSTVAFTNELLEANRDLVLNAFNWASAREYRVSVGAKSPQTRRLDVQTGSALATLNAIAVLLLPGLCLALGLFTAWRRRR